MRDIRDSILTPIILTAILLFACGKSDDKAETSGKPAAAKKAPLEYKPIAWMGLKANVAKDADISDTSADAPAAMVYSNGCTVMLSTVTAAYGNFDASVKEAEKGIGNKVTKWIVKEKTADGFHIEFDGTSMMDEPIRDVTVRRKIGSKEINCSRAGSAEEVSCVAPVCASLQAI